VGGKIEAACVGLVVLKPPKIRFSFDKVIAKYFTNTLSRQSSKLTILKTLDKDIEAHIGVGRRNDDWVRESLELVVSSWPLS